MEITPKDVIKVLEGCINFMTVELASEALSPSTEMEREDNVDRLQEFVKKLQNMKSFAPPTNGSPNLRGTGSASPAFSKMWKSENKAGLHKRLSQDCGKTKKESEKTDASSNSSSTSDLPQPPSDLLDDTVEEEDYEVPVGAKPELIEEEDYEVPLAGDHTKKKEDAASSDTGTLNELQQKVKTLEKCSPQEMKSKAIYSGYLLKHKKRLLTKWHKRFCVLVNEFLFYYKSDTDKKEQGYIILPGYTITIPPKDKGFVFVLENEDKTRDCYAFQADSIEDAENWQRHVQAVTSIKLSSQINVTTQQNGFDSESSEGSGSAQVEEVCEKVTTPAIQEDFYDDVCGAIADVQCDDIYDDVAGSTQVPPPSPKPKSPANIGIPPAYIPPRSPDVGGALPAPSADIPPRNSQAIQRPRNSLSSFTVDNIYMGMHNCMAEDEQDLAFNRGDVMYILDKIDTHWWLGYLNGKVGLVPSNHLTTAFVN